MSLLALTGRALRQVVRRLVRLYYPDLAITGRDRLPPGGPLLLVANHPNSVIDPAVLGLTVRRPVHFLAKAPLFDVPVFGTLMRALGMIPAYRGRDAADQVRRNAASLQAAADWLVRGQAVGIFPEGVTHDELHVEQVRSGAARLAIQAAQAGAGVVVVPVGLNYECKERFRSAVWVRIGEPIEVPALLREFPDAERRAIRHLTGVIDRRLRAVAVHLNEPAWAVFLPALEVLLPPPADEAALPGAPVRQRKRIADAMNHFLATDRTRAEALAAAIEAHRQALVEEGLTMSSDLLRWHGRRLAVRLAVRLLALLAVFVPAVAGVVHHLVPFVLTRWPANRLKDPGRATVALNRLLVGLPLYTAAYAGIGWLLARGFSGRIATVWTSLMPLAGLAALWFCRTGREVVAVLGHELRLLTRRRRLYELRRRQLELRQQLRQLAAEYTRAHPPPAAET